MHSFSIMYLDKERVYYCESETEYRNWINSIQNVTGFVDLNMKYEVKETLGEGRFGQVKACVLKATGKEAAIKIINKKLIDPDYFHVLKNEIEVLKICQHPHIIKLYDILENEDYIYISMHTSYLII